MQKFLFEAKKIIDYGTKDALTRTEDTNEWLGEGWLLSEEFILTILIIVGIVLVCIFADKLMMLLLKTYAKVGENPEDNPQKVLLVHVFSSIIKGIAVAMGIIFILQINGIQVGALVTSASIVSAVIGLALQDAIKDIIQGIHIVSDKYFGVGDVIRYEGIDGKVISVTLRATKIRDIRTDNLVTIANRHISSAVKLSHWHDINLNLSYEEDSEKILAALEEVSKKIAKVKGVESCQVKGIQDFGESSVVYKIRLFAKPENIPQLHRNAMKLIWDGFKEKDIQIPFNQLDVHFDDDVEPLKKKGKQAFDENAGKIRQKSYKETAENEKGIR